MHFSKNDSFLIVGLGISGYSAAKLAAYKGLTFAALDESDNLQLREKKDCLEELGGTVFLNFREDFLPFSTHIVMSPGISPFSKIGNLVALSGRIVMCELDFAATFCNSKLLGITGTNGKTTVTEMCTYALNRLGKKAISAGNIGKPLSEIVMMGQEFDVITLEISSFQLHYVDNLNLFAATILNISSDHINWHGSYYDYENSKKKISKHTENLIINSELLDLFKDLNQNIKTFGINLGDICLCSDDCVYLNFEKLKYKLPNEFIKSGFHNTENLLATVLLINLLDIDVLKILSSLSGFKYGSHRLEFVDEIDEVIYINDSKSTNPHSLVAALRAVGNSKNVCLIAGGLDKNMDFSIMLSEVDKIKHVFLIGKSQDALEKILKDILNYSKHFSLKDAVISARRIAVKGDVVLLSPGCASMDMFIDYIDRGNHFKTLINRRDFNE